MSGALRTGSRSRACRMAALLVLSATAGCRGCRASSESAGAGAGAGGPFASAAAGSAAGRPGADAAADPLPLWYPSTLDPAKYAGAAACADCHRDVYERWRVSPHGRAMARPDESTVLGDFSGRTIEVEGRTVTALRNGRGYVVRVAAEGAAEDHPVELVLASGRQHQLYLSRGRDGGLRPLPIYWATRAREWRDTRMHRGISMDPSDPHYWGRSDVVSEGNCFYCHLSQGRARADGATLEHQWVDLSINCESCHGPARAHVDARRAGAAGPPLPDLRALSNVEEAHLCGRCHAAQRGAHEDGSRDLQYLTLASGLFRADATQLGAGYQLAGHVTSGCFNRGAATCSGCHDPHRQTARSLAGEDAAGAHANRQCTACHRNLLDAAAARRHGHHGDAVRCIDCHMPRHPLFDDAAARQEVSDHGIQIPRPRETIELGVPNACNRCHAGQSPEWALDALGRWQQRRATGVRDWARAIALAQRHDRGSVEGLLQIVRSPDAPEFVKASALDFLGSLPPDERVADVVAPLSESGDFWLRALALRALFTHDLARRATWLSGAASDPHPLARLVALAASGPTPFGEEQVGVLLRDIGRLWTVPPANALRLLAAIEAGNRRFQPALDLMDLALRHGTPRQIEMAQLRGFRETIARAAMAP